MRRGGTAICDSLQPTGRRTRERSKRPVGEVTALDIGFPGHLAIQFLLPQAWPVFIVQPFSNIYEVVTIDIEFGGDLLLEFNNTGVARGALTMALLPGTWCIQLTKTSELHPYLNHLRWRGSTLA